MSENSSKPYLHCSLSENELSQIRDDYFAEQKIAELKKRMQYALDHMSSNKKTIQWHIQRIAPQMDPIVKKQDTWWIPLLEDDDLYDEYTIAKKKLKELLLEGNICLSEMNILNTSRVRWIPIQQRKRYSNPEEYERIVTHMNSEYSPKNHEHYLSIIAQIHRFRTIIRQIEYKLDPPEYI